MTTDSYEALAPTVAEVNLSHLRHNVHQLKKQAGTADIMAVVKANAYGHGAIRIARALSEEGIRHFAVATLPEGIALRKGGIDGRIFVLAGPLPEYLPSYAAFDLEVNVSSLEIAGSLAMRGTDDGPFRVHIEVDTGMNRLGMTAGDARGALKQLRDSKGIEVVGLWTHLATADAEDTSFSEEQLQQFGAFLKDVSRGNAAVHAANSDALLHIPRAVHAAELGTADSGLDRAADARELCRIGLALYGMAGTRARADSAGLRPVMRVTSRVTQVKTVAAGDTVSYGRHWTAEEPTRIATVAAGYADGYFRLLGNRSEVAVRGRRYPVVGAVCMDMIMLKLGPPDGAGAAVQVGDEVILFGEGGPSAYDVASWAETIPYEVCTNVSRRVPRHYIE